MYQYSHTQPLIATVGLKELTNHYPKRLLLYNIDVREEGGFRTFLQDILTDEKYFISSIDLDWKTKASKELTICDLCGCSWAADVQSRIVPPYRRPMPESKSPSMR